MLVGQQFGPFTIDKELGSGAMGTVYRGRFTKTGQIMAIKIMAPGIGSTNAAAVDRFEREIAILKQLNHPNIVRFYGSGKHQGMRYFAMEYIDGEGLDKVMARRGRMTWEEVVELGKQLCSALQHAHEQGIIHRDLKPSNVMVQKDGTLKLTDFGIAKDIDLEGLTATNCTVGTASYMSPEQCKGERNLTHKSDLYSLGVMFYELVTGRKPFQANSAMEMFMEHVNGTFERPSRLVLDIPIWLDTLICQLLEKDPDKRPRDASMVALALDNIREKVEAQQSVGVEAVRRRLIDRAPGQKRLDEEDKDAARVLLTGKGKSRRKRGKRPFYEKGWFQAIGLALALGVVISLLYLTFRTPPPDKLYRQIQILMESGNSEAQENALGPDGLITKYLREYGKQDNEQLRYVRRCKMQIQVAGCERVLETHMQQVRGKSLFMRKPNGKTEADAFDAVEAEEKGDREKAVTLWQTIEQREGQDSPWAEVANQRLKEWNALDQIEEKFKLIYRRIHRSGEEPPGWTDEHEQAAFLAWRMEHAAEKDSTEVGDLRLARTLFQTLREELEKEAGLRKGWYLYAAWHKHELDRKLEEQEETTTEKVPLKERVRRRLEMVRQLHDKKSITKTDAKFVCLDILALYDQNKDMAPVVEEAKKLLQDVSE